MTSLRHPWTALLAALGCLGGLIVTGVLAYLVPIAQARDSVTLQGFVALNRPAVSGLLGGVAHLADPRPYAIAGLALAIVAARRRRLPVAVAILAVLVLTGASTELLKQVLAHPRFSDWLGGGQILAASWPSGHATAAMTLALCAVLAVPPAARPTAGALGALFAVGVSYSILALGWHFPSDVIGGFFVASMWTLLAVAALGAHAARGRATGRSGRAPAPPAGRWHAAGPAVVGAGALAVVLAAAIARPGAAATFAGDHPWFLVGALAIATLAAALAAGLARGVQA